jgi:choline dehydrogenase-like flavoprotein
MSRSYGDASVGRTTIAICFLLGSGLFPTGATVNPTLTLAAPALRSAAEMRRAFAANELR